MYMIPTVTFWSNGSPVRPSNRVIWPESGRPANRSCRRISPSLAPSNTGLA